MICINLSQYLWSGFLLFFQFDYLSNNKIELLFDISKSLMPIGLQYLCCNNNQLTKLENLPIGLTKLYCGNNQLTKLENLPLGLQYLFCGNNQLTKLENLPIGLTKLWCGNNQLTKLENLPIGLQYLYYDGNPIEYVDDSPFNDINFTLKGYQAIRRIQLRMKRRYKIKNNAARVIQNGCHNWLWSPKLKDGSIGIVPRLALQRLQLI